MGTTLQKPVVLFLGLLVLSLTGAFESLIYTKCFGEFLDDDLCWFPATIWVNDIQFGVHKNACYPKELSCCPGPEDCFITGEESQKTDFIERVKTNCNGNQNCGGLIVEQASGWKCDEPGTDYVIIFHDCMIDNSTVAPPTTSSTGTSTTSPVTTPILPPPKTPALSGGEIAGIVFGVIFGLLLIFFIIFAILARKNHPSWPQIHNWTEPFRDLKSYVPTRITSAMNRVMRRQEPEGRASQTKRQCNGTGGIANNANGHAGETINNAGPQHSDVAYVSRIRKEDISLPVEVQIVGRPRKALDGAVHVQAGLPPGGVEPLYETIDDFARSDSPRDSDSYASFDSIGLEENELYENSPCEANGMTNNGAIDTGAVEVTTMTIENNIYDRATARTNSDRRESCAAEGRTLEVNNTSDGKTTPHSSKHMQTSPKPGHKSLAPPQYSPGVKRIQRSPNSNPNTANKFPASTTEPRGNTSTLSVKLAAALAAKASLDSGMALRVFVPTGPDGGQVYENAEFSGEDAENNYYNVGGLSAVEKPSAHPETVTPRDVPPTGWTCESAHIGGEASSC